MCVALALQVYEFKTHDFKRTIHLPELSILCEVLTTILVVIFVYLNRYLRRTLAVILA